MRIEPATIYTYTQPNLRKTSKKTKQDTHKQNNLNIQTKLQITITGKAPPTLSKMNISKFY